MLDFFNSMYGFSAVNEQISHHTFQVRICEGFVCGLPPIFPSHANAWIYIYGQSCCSIYDWQWRHTEHCWETNEGEMWKSRSAILKSESEMWKSRSACKSILIFPFLDWIVSMRSSVGLLKKWEDKINVSLKEQAFFSSVKLGLLANQNLPCYMATNVLKHNTIKMCICSYILAHLSICKHIIYVYLFVCILSVFVFVLVFVHLCAGFSGGRGSNYSEQWLLLLCFHQLG